MSKFPVELSDQEGIVDAVNYVLSGPQLPGRSTEGFVSDQTAYVTGNYRAPWTQAGPVSLLRTESIATTTWLDENTIRFDFTSPAASPPFALGNNLTVAGVTPSDYDSFYSGDGVVECTTTYVIIRTRTPQPNYGPGTGGTLLFDAADPNIPLPDDPYLISTDCNAKITVNYSNSQVNINAQLKNTIQYAALYNLQGVYGVEINRYKGFPNNEPSRPGFYFQFDKTITQREYLLALADTADNVVSADVSLAPPLPYTNTRAQPSLAYPATYTVTTTNVLTGIGQGLQVRVTIAADFPGGPPWNPLWPFPPAAYTNANTTIEIIDGGEGYQVGDQILIDGADIGGVSGVDDLVLQIQSTGISTGNDSRFVTYETVFSGVEDNDPPLGYYWYIMDIYFKKLSGGTLYIYGCKLEQRSLTAQALKQ